MLMICTGLQFVKGLLPHAHWTIARGDGPSNKAYCTKEDSRHNPHVFLELGELMNQGKRTDLEVMAHQLMTAQQDEVKFADIAMDNPTHFIRYNRGMKALYNLAYVPQERPPPTVIYLHGDTGCGKSTWVRNLLLTKRPRDFMIKMTGVEWWDGYHEQAIVWFDEFDTGTVPYRVLLQVLDRMEIRVNVKTDTAVMKAHIFIFCSNRYPSVIYPHETDLAPLNRRLGEIIEFHRPDLCPVPREYCDVCTKLGDFTDKL